MDGENFENFWEAVSTILAFIFLVTLIIAPISFIKMLLNY